jgi:hypothetical protein
MTNITALYNVHSHIQARFYISKVYYNFSVFISQLKLTAINFRGKFIAVAFKQLLKIMRNKGL